MIKMSSVTKVYQTGDVCQRVLDGVGLEIRKGEMVALMGASGSGKTTLLNIIGLLDEVTEGEYYMNGCDMRECGEKEKARIRNQEMGFVFQNFHLIPELTAVENVKLSMDIFNLFEGRRMTQREMYARSSELLASVGLERELKKKPSQLSGGQKQRVAIARALVNRPDIILADEPTGALDHRTSDEIMGLLGRLNEEGHTVLIVTHDEKVAGACGRTVYLEDGVVVGEENGLIDQV